MTKRLEAKCWESMLDAESPIFEPALLALIKQKPKNSKGKKAIFPSLSFSMFTPSSQNTLRRQKLKRMMAKTMTVKERKRNLKMKMMK